VQRRLALVYVGVFAISGALASGSFVLGKGRHSQPKVGGVYAVDSPCLGGQAQLKLEQSGEFVDAKGLGAASRFEGSLRFRNPRLTGRVQCVDGSGAQLTLTRVGPRDAKSPQLVGTLAGRPLAAEFLKDLPKPGVPITKAQSTPPSGDQVFGRLMLAIAAVILAARLVRALVGRVGQPPVMGEVLAGILLGPTLLGAVAPSLQHYLFPSFVIPLLTGAADIGLAFYMFLVGLELDSRLLRGRIAHAAAISNASVVLPLGLGIAVALPLYRLLGTPDKSYQAFGLFMGVAMSITAFPVLARILIERRMLGRPLGALALSAAAVDDVTAWGLLAIASGIAGRGSALGALTVLGYVFAFCAAMALLARPLLRRVSAAYDEAGHVPAGWISAIFVGVLLSAYVSMKSGIAPIFGAFVMGLVMPRRADLSHDVTRRLEDFVTTVLLPLFFVVTGLRTDIGLLNRPELWGLTALLIVVAIAGKWLAAMITARAAGYRWRESAVLGALMNTRGLTELIVLNVGLDLGVISSALFTMLVLMALVTTFMTAPLLRLLDPRGELALPVEDELPRAEPGLAGSILVAPLAQQNIDELLALAEPLARSEPRRELIIVRLLEPPRVGATLATRDRELARATAELDWLRNDLVKGGQPARTVAFTSGNRADDLVRLAEREGVELLLIDGRRPLLGPGIPGGEVGQVLTKALCEVAVLVDQEEVPVLDTDHPVVVVFAGEEHDSAGLGLGERLAEQTSAPLRVVASPDEVGEVARGAGLLVLGLPALWGKQGLGPVRAALALAGDTPTLFVRRAKAG
jgi:K+:H+ antiporter